MAVEIERKYLPADPLWRPDGAFDHILQGFFWLDGDDTARIEKDSTGQSFFVLKAFKAGAVFSIPLPAADAALLAAQTFGKNWLARVRAVNHTRYLFTIKGPSSAGGLARPEYEYEIPAPLGEALLAATVETWLEKRRYKIPYQGFIWEVDVFDGYLADKNLVLIEVEMQSEADNPPQPFFVGCEVTEIKNYRNSWLAKRKPLPEDDIL